MIPDGPRTREQHFSILRSLAAGNFHEGGIRAAFIKDVSDDLMHDLLADVRTITHDRRPSVVKAGQHVTGWTNPQGLVCQWSLFNRHGRTDDTSDDFTYNLRGKQPIAMPSIQRLAAQLPGLVNLRLNIISPGSGLSPHEEHLPRRIGTNSVSLRARFHLPLFTNDQCFMLADGDLFHFKVGKLYLFNNGCVHGATNNGDTERAHLVWDQLMTKEAMYAMFTKAGLTADTLRTNLPPVRSIGIHEWAPSTGMTRSEFDRRTLVVHP